MFDHNITEILSLFTPPVVGDAPVEPAKPVVFTFPCSNDPRFVTALKGVKDLPRPERNAVLSLLTRWIELLPDRRACYASAILPELTEEELAVLSGLSTGQLYASHEYQQFKRTLVEPREAKSRGPGEAAATPDQVVPIPGLDDDSVFTTAVDAFRNLTLAEQHAAVDLAMRWVGEPKWRACLARTVMPELTDADIALMCGREVDGFRRTEGSQAAGLSPEDDVTNQQRSTQTAAGSRRTPDGGSDSPFQELNYPLNQTQIEEVLKFWENMHFKRIFPVIRKKVGCEHNAEEVLQLFRLKVWVLLCEGQAPLQAPEKWLMTIAKNVAIDLLRAQGCRKEHVKRLAGWRELRSEVDPYAELERRDTNKIVAAAVDSLEPSLKTVVERRFFEGRTLVETAAQLDLSVDGAGKRQRRALRRLREDLQLLLQEPEEPGKDSPL
jgi:RNA polymerase sigma-70 factor, ECF subfamily